MNESWPTRSRDVGQLARVVGEGRADAVECLSEMGVERRERRVVYIAVGRSGS